MAGGEGVASGYFRGFTRVTGEVADRWIKGVSFFSSKEFIRALIFKAWLGVEVGGEE